MQISLIEFSIENFKIFKERNTFSMVSRKNEHTFNNNGENLLKTSLIYGPNASGKSTFLLALTIVRNGIINSANNQAEALLPYFPFLFSEQTEKVPVFFEIIFSLDEKVFKYNFSILKDKIITENLSEVLLGGTEKVHFSRKENDIKLYQDFKDNDDLKAKTRKETLFLSVASQWNNQIAIKIVKGFLGINIIDAHNMGNGIVAANLLKNDENIKIKVLDFLKQADFCINDIKLKDIEIPQQVLSQIKALNPEKAHIDVLNNKMTTVMFSHPKFNSENKNIGLVELNLADESVGTQRFFSILGPVIDTLQNGRVLFIDEFDGSLHPLLTKFIIDLFEKNNFKNAQLIATTHDVSLLSYKNTFDKAQFWFTEKDRFGAAKLFSLAEFKIRNDTEFSKKYLEGRFGALPLID